jgi:hypothetical protein
MWHIGGKREMHARFWWGNSKERHYLDNLDIDGRTIFKPIFNKWDGRVWIGLIWLRTRTSGWLL